MVKLYLRIGPTGAKSWIFRYRRDGKLNDMGLGTLHTVSLADARQKAQDCRKLRLQKTDPIVNGSTPVPGRSDSNTDRLLGRLAP